MRTRQLLISLILFRFPFVYVVDIYEKPIICLRVQEIRTEGVLEHLLTIDKKNHTRTHRTLTHLHTDLSKNRAVENVKY